MEKTENDRNDWAKTRSTSGWPADWKRWFASGLDSSNRGEHRLDRIRRTVRRALRELSRAERMIVECYYYDGISFGGIADRQGVSLARVRVLHRHALTELERLLTPFVQETFGIEVIQYPDCPVCSAPWRNIAESVLDSRTADLTWGQIAKRIERATGWAAPSPQTLITHQKHHRLYERPPAPRRSSNNPFLSPEEDS